MAFWQKCTATAAAWSKWDTCGHQNSRHPGRMRNQTETSRVTQAQHKQLYRQIVYNITQLIHQMAVGKSHSLIGAVSLSTIAVRFIYSQWCSVMIVLVTRGLGSLARYDYHCWTFRYISTSFFSWKSDSAFGSQQWTLTIRLHLTTLSTVALKVQTQRLWKNSNLPLPTLHKNAT